MGEIVLTVAGIGIAVKWVVSTIRQLFDPNATWPNAVYSLMALALAEASCYIWHVSALSADATTSHVGALFAEGLTGVMIAGAASVVHDTVASYKYKADVAGAASDVVKTR